MKVRHVAGEVGPMTGTGLTGVTVVRGGTTLLRDVTLQAADGELMVVLGSSGSGKSTLLRVLAGLDSVDSGEVTIRGRDVTRMPPGGRRVSMVFEASALIPFLDVSHNLGWGLKVQGIPGPEVRSRVSGRARQLGLGRLLSRRPGELAGGERSLVNIGHALVSAPDVFLLDEPLGDLDAVHRTEVRRQIVEAVRRRGTTTFYVTHDQAEGFAVADRVAFLHQGEVVQVGRPRDLYDRPASLLVAGFIGTEPIGLLPARLVVSAGMGGFRVGTRTLPLWRSVPDPLLDSVGRDVVLALRAEDVSPARSDHDPDSVALDGTVIHAEYTGARNVVTAAVAAPPVTAPGVERSEGTTLRVLFPPRAVLRPGDAVRIAVDAARAHVFDAVTGRALWHPDGTDGGSG
jgi:multiple sugar transport system ATP-binding protein